MNQNLDPYGPRTPWRPPPAVVPRSSIGAMALSFFIPGAGSIYGGEAAIGVIIQCAWLLSALLCLVVIGWLLIIPPFGTLAEWAYRGFLVGRKLWR